MEKLVAEDHHADELQEGLASHGFKHLRVRHRADTLTIESGAKGADAFPHARLRRETRRAWRLEMPTSTGRWETTPIRDETDNLIAILVSDFAWALAKPPTITTRTSGRKY
jgi:hypothetical protein